MISYKQQDLLDPYNKFDEWTKRTGILNGDGLTWIVRIPVNIIFVLVLLIRAVVLWAFDRVRGGQVDAGR